MYLAIGMSQSASRVCGLEETWGKSSVKQRTGVWTAQPGVKQVSLPACVGMFLCVEQLSYVENIPEGP